MKRVFINEKPIVFCRTGKQKTVKGLTKKSLILPYMGKVKQLHQFVDTLEKGSGYDMIVLHHSSPKMVWQLFIDLFTPIIAGGGLVVNQKDKILAIHRRGYWDLPKGKQDPGETKRQCALREVKEETGVKNVKIINKIGRTYHVYRTKSGRMLKISHWYLMTAPHQVLVPQIEEDITKAKWLTLAELDDRRSKTYKNIISVIDRYRVKH